MTNNITFRLIVTLVLGFFLGSLLPTSVQSILFAISLSLKTILIFFLPFIIFSCLFSCLLSFKSKVFYFLILLLGCICLSNFLTTTFSYFVGKFVLFNFPIVSKVVSSQNELKPAWDFAISPLISNDTALFSGLICGIIFSRFRFPKINTFAEKLRHYVSFFLNKLFIPVLPLFALGFVIKLNSDGILGDIVKSYLSIAVAIICAQFVYIFTFYFAASRFRIKRTFSFLQNVFPASLMGFSTMSSMAALPLTIKAAEKNTGQVDLARTIAPATVNVHLMGDCIAIPMLALAILSTFGFSIPSTASFLIFAIYFVLAKFAVAAVPGGGILVMVPLLQEHLGFNSAMSALIIAIYILLDPIITTANVTGNGVFTIIVSKITKNLFKTT